MKINKRECTRTWRCIIIWSLTSRVVYIYIYVYILYIYICTQKKNFCYITVRMKRHSVLQGCCPCFGPSWRIWPFHFTDCRLWQHITVTGRTLIIVLLFSVLWNVTFNWVPKLQCTSGSFLGISKVIMIHHIPFSFLQWFEPIHPSESNLPLMSRIMFPCCCVPGYNVKKINC